MLRRGCARDFGISIHALREEGDGALCAVLPAAIQFLSTPSARRATCPRGESTADCRNFYPRPPRGGRREDVRVSRQRRSISIHALREEGDGFSSMYLSIASYFYPRPPRGGRRSDPAARGAGLAISIHALREEGDVSFGMLRPQTQEFLSTPSARRATAMRGMFFITS